MPPLRCMRLFCLGSDGESNQWNVRGMSAVLGLSIVVHLLVRTRAAMLHDTRGRSQQRCNPFSQLGGQQAPRVLPAGRWLLSVKVPEFSSLLSSFCSRSERTWSALRSGVRHPAPRKVCDCSSIRKTSVFLSTYMHIFIYMHVYTVHAYRQFPQPC
jgi:hypothetical protein